MGFIFRLDYFFNCADRADLEDGLFIKILLTSMCAILVDYCRPFEIVTREPFPFFTPSLIYAFKFREARFYWLVNNGYYARRRIPAFKDSIGCYLELKENGARRDGTTKYRDDDALNKRVGEGEKSRKSPSLLSSLANFTGVLC